MNWVHHCSKISPVRLACDLSKRQREVLVGIANGWTTGEIAEQIGCSVKTVEYHRSILIARTNCNDVAGLTKLAIRLGLTDIETHRVIG